MQPLAQDIALMTISERRMEGRATQTPPPTNFLPYLVLTKFHPQTGLPYHIRGKREYATPPCLRVRPILLSRAPGHGQLRHHQDSNSRSPDDRANAFLMEPRNVVHGKE